jgi:Ca2+-binding RTX toxin-like protein
MANVSTAAANRRLDMSSAALVQYSSAPTTQPSNFGYVSSSGGDRYVQFFGSGLTYAGSGAAVELSGGTVTGFELDLGYSDVILAPELSITGLVGIDAAAIDKDNAASIWAEVLKGNDVFDLTGLDEDQVGLGLNVVFGDDLAAALSADGSVSDRGGKDRIQGGDNDFELIGDVYNVAGAGQLTARYAGRNDRIGSGGVAAGITDRSILMAGDARNVGPDGILNGGDDRLTLIDFSGQGRIAGDAYHAGGPTDGHGSRVNGGADSIVVGSTGAADIIVAGDVMELVGFVLVNGGNDVIRLSGPAGSLAGDVMELYSADVVVYGGDDQLVGADGNDLLVGDVGHTNYYYATIYGGDDLIEGGKGQDWIYGDYATVDQGLGDYPAGAGGDDTLHGGRDDDLVYGQGGDDRVFGDEGADILYGDFGDDILQGGDGADVLQGDAGNDILQGGAGADRLVSGEGADKLFGDGERDRFVYPSTQHSGPSGAERDRIADFTQRVDLIDLLAIDAIEGGGAGPNDAFTFIGSNPFVQAGQLRAVQVGDDTLVQANTVGPGGPEMSILLLNFTASELSAQDFVL